MTAQRVLVALCGASILISCAGDASESGFTLPILDSIPVETSVVGSTTTLPLTEEEYMVQDGDTLFGIAQIFGVTMESLITYNAIANPDDIRPGLVLKVPNPTNPSGTTTSTAAP